MKNVLVIAGLDPSGGAGLLADAQVLAAHGLRCVGVVTASTEQDSTGVRAVQALPAAFVAAQVRAALADARPRAVKIGMLATLGIAWEVGDALGRARMPMVWDPVCMPTRGGVALFDGDMREAFAMLAPHVSLVTPNVDELALISGMTVTNEAQQLAAARAVLEAGARAVLAKGGHLPGAEAVDLLITDADAPPLRLASPRMDPGPLHGTGCVLASAIAAGLAGGATLADAVQAAKCFVDARLAAPLVSGQGARTLV